MPDVKDLMQHALETATTASPPPDDFDRFVRYRERRHRNQRIVAGAVALVLAVAVIGSMLTVLRTSDDRRPGSSGSLVIDPGINQACGAQDPCWDADVFVMRADGSTVTRLGFDEERDFAYSWSPDGERIAFYHAAGVEGGGRFDATADIYTMAADGSAVRQLTDDPALDLFPVFSPDGSKIAFTSDRAGTVDVWVMDADGSNKRRLTNNGATNWAPSWHPDGKRIIFSSNMDDWREDIGKFGHNFELYLINADGIGLERITYNNVFDSFPMFSHDGKKIVFASNRNPQKPRATDIFIADWVE